MKYERRRAKLNLAAGGVLLLAALLISGCNAQPHAPANPASTQTPVEITALAAAPTVGQPPVTPTLAPMPSPTSIPLPSPTLPPPEPTATLTPAVVEAAELERESSEAVAAESPLPLGMALTETSLPLPTYPFRDFLIEQIDPRYSMPVFYLDRPAYEAIGPASTPVEYQAIVLENPYLALTFLPELGGRLYSAVVKSTGQEIFYHNPVVKPTRYGILQPAEANWWLATGGMEWAYPVQEHGYRFGVPWAYQVTTTAESITLTLSDTGPDRVGVEVAVTLPADSASFSVTPTLTNQGAEAVPVQFWLNAVLALAPETMSLNTRFIVPADQVQIHSRGASGWQVPDSQAEVTWPTVEGLDLSDYSQWTDYLGFFVPQDDLPFMGAYNPDTDLGVVRLPQPGSISGHKLFAFGKDFWDKSYSDNNSQYFELWGGINQGFWPEDDVSVAPGQSVGWQEQWWPLAQLGGLTWATPQVAIAVSANDGLGQLTALFARPTSGQLTIRVEDAPLLSEPFVAEPGRPLRWSISPENGPLHLQFKDDEGVILLDHCLGC